MPLQLSAKLLTKEEIDTVMWFCVSCCGVSSWAQFAQLIMRCEREDVTLDIIKDWHECQHGKVRDYAAIKAVQSAVYPLIQEYKYAQHC